MNIRRIAQLLYRGVRLKCPRCGEGALFAGFFAMHQRCPSCAVVFEREQGYFVGAIYINYTATTLIAIAGFLVLDAWTSLSLPRQLLCWGTFAIFFPLFFFRYSRSFWLSLDYMFSPPDALEGKNVFALRRNPRQ